MGNNFPEAMLHHDILWQLKHAAIFAVKLKFALHYIIFEKSRKSVLQDVFAQRIIVC